jgi:hypothetical protein
MSARPAVRGAACALALALAAPAGAVSDAPLELDTPGPVRGLFLDMPLSDARPPARPQVGIRWSFANAWSRAAVLERGAELVVVQGDAQADVLRLALTVPWSRFSDSGLAARAATSVEGRLVAWWGGWSDRPIEAWHGLVGSWNFERQLYPRDAVRLELSQVNGPRLADVDGAQVAAGDVAVRTRIQLAGDVDPAARFAVALRVDVKVPTGRLSAMTGSSRPDGGLGLAVTWAPAPWVTVHALGSARVVSPLPRGFALQPRQVQGGLDAGVVVRFRSGLALVLEDRVSTPLVEAGWRLPQGTEEPEATSWYALDRPHNQVSGGLRWREVTAFFSEDFTPGSRLRTDSGPPWFYDSNAPDFLFGVEWRREL